jgi:hypothetical protein
MAYTTVHLRNGVPYAPTAAAAKALRIDIAAAERFAGPFVTAADVHRIIDHFHPYLSKRERTKLGWLLADLEQAAGTTTR